MSAYDLDATYRQKGDKKSSGHSVNIKETCGEDNPIQLIVDCMVEKNTISDQDFLKKTIPNIDEKNYSLSRWWLFLSRALARG